MKRTGRLLSWLLLLAPYFVSAQLDPVRRDLLQLGYNQPLEGHAPFAGYAFFYHNQPDFLHTNLTLRLAIAPVYLDSELGFVGALGPNTDLGVGVAGGGFSDNYYEIRGGTYYPDESFDGYGAGASLGIYHLFNPAARIPLNFVLRAGMHYSLYADNDGTAANFQLPDNHGTVAVRTGLRWGGVEPTLFPPLAMEVSVWYEGQYRTASGAYGFNSGDELNSQSHLFWGDAALAYTLPKSQQSFYVRLTAGTSIDADHFSAYRLGGFLPLISEFPLSLPGYYYQEISARQFALLNANYLLPLDVKKRWDLDLNASTAWVDYLPGEEQPGNWLSGVGGGILFHSPSDRLKVLATYAYGINAIRSHGRGANSFGLLFQWDLGHEPTPAFKVLQPQHWRSWW
ncbi:MAG TPA: hypothetical protein VMJ12_09510 [Candidatus Acidoferrales bacterium]|nr:hypothetical protein [Candidatus Acidoferrales bacterium]